MTSPMNPIVLQEEGIGESVAKGLQPLIAAIQERKQREIQKQQVLAQIGQLKLAQDQEAEKQRVQKEQAKGMEEQAMALAEQAKNLENPGQIEKELMGAARSGDARLLMATSERIQRLLAQKKLQEIGTRYQGKIDPMSQYIQAVEMFQADPTPSMAGVVGTLGNQVFQSTRDQWDKAPAVKMPDGTYHRIATNMRDPSIKIDLGEVAAPYTERFAEYGDVAQRVSARTALKMKNAYDVVKGFATNDAVMDQAAAALTATEGATNTPLNLGQFLGFWVDASTKLASSPDAQVVLNNIGEMLAAEGFGEGGKTLTATEWAKAVRSLAPLGGESRASRVDKLKRWNVRWRTHARQAGPAWLKIKDLTPDEADMQLKQIDALEEFMRRTQEEFAPEEDN